MRLMRVDKSKARLPDEEYWYWFYKLHSIIDNKLPWDMHPNEIRAGKMYKAKIERKMYAALDLMEQVSDN